MSISIILIAPGVRHFQKLSATATLELRKKLPAFRMGIAFAGEVENLSTGAMFGCPLAT
jgi:hypothetical protein